MSLGTLETMVQWVDENCGCSPTLDCLAAHMGYSPYYCSTEFHRFTGLSFRAYVGNKKLELAIAEMKRKEKRLLDIALEIGFSSHEAFTRAFAKRYGCSPSQYRREEQP